MSVSSNIGIKGARISFNSTTEQEVITGVKSQVHYIRRLKLSVAGATNITIRDGLAGNILEVLQFPGAGMVILDDAHAFTTAYWATSAGGSFTMQSSNAVQIEGRLTYETAQ